MRLHVSAPIAMAVLLVACGRNAGGGQNAASTNEAAPVPSAPAAPTDAQKKKALASLPAAYQSADLDNGQVKFALCKSCHTAARDGANMTGPNLYDVFGRRAGTLPGFAYSDALKVSKIVWTADTLDKWIANPRTDIPGTKMTYLGMENPKDRTDLIAYLKVVTTPNDR